MIRALALFIKHAPGLTDHVVDHVALGDLLGPELRRRGEVVPVIVAQVVVGHDGLWLDARIDEKVDQHGLELGLSGFEVVAADENLLLLGQLNASRYKSVLRGAV